MDSGDNEEEKKYKKGGKGGEGGESPRRFICGEDGCEYESKLKKALKTHKANIHDIDVTYYLSIYAMLMGVNTNPRMTVILIDIKL